MPIQTESYDAIFDKYSESIQWMMDLGVKIGTGRISHYEEVVRYWKDKYKTATEDEGKSIFPDFVSSLFEIHDFVDIYEAFRGFQADQLTSIVEKLQKGVNGPINAAEETPRSTTARNFLFEATVAARSHRPENGVDVILDAESDTGFRIGGKKVWVECKRITTPEKIHDNTRKASRQLESLLKKKVGSGHRGIVAMDISKILNSGDKIWVSHDDEQLLSSINDMMNTFIRQYSQVWERNYARRNKKVIGTMIRLVFMSASEPRNILIHTAQWTVTPRIGVSASDDQLLRVLVAELKESS